MFSSASFNDKGPTTQQHAVTARGRGREVDGVVVVGVNERGERRGGEKGGVGRGGECGVMIRVSVQLHSLIQSRGMSLYMDRFH